ncbi:MAG: Ig-like domain-containing protein, partial [Synechococcus sp.]
ISAAALNQYSDELQQWQTALSENADILFYGCNVAAGQKGATFLNQIGELTGADIAASTDLTGSSKLGGDWQLEYASGEIETSSPFADAIRQNYGYVLQSSGASNDSVFAGQDGKIVIEAESAKLNGGWVRTTIANRTAVLYRGENNLKTADPSQQLEYRFKTDRSGRFSIALHSARQNNLIEEFESHRGNDAFISIVNAKTGRPVLPTTKFATFFGNSNLTYKWGGTFSRNHNLTPAVVNLQGGTEYRFLLTGRSRGYAVDRITLSDGRSFRSLDAPQSRRVLSDGGNPSMDDSEGTTPPDVAPSDGGSPSMDGSEGTTPPDVAQSAPTAKDDSYTLREDSQFKGNVFLGSGTDIAGAGRLRVVQNTEPSNGSLSIKEDGSFTYTPQANFNGKDTFRYTVQNGDGVTDTATVTLNVQDVNDRPTAKFIPRQRSTDGSRVNLDMSEYFGDRDGNIASYSIQGLPRGLSIDKNGIISGKLLARASNGDGTNDGSRTYSVTVRATDDDGASVKKSFRYTVNNVDPLAVNDRFSTGKGKTVRGNVLQGPGADRDGGTDGDKLKVIAHTKPANGSLVIWKNGVFRYRPKANFTGQDTFTYTVDDGNGGTDKATVTVTVGGDAPVVRPPSPQPNPGSSFRIEAESLRLKGYRVESNSFASKGKLISLRGGKAKETGSATYVHRRQAGTFDIDLRYFDENDGVSTMTVKLNGKQIDRWTLNALTNGTNVSAGTSRVRKLRGITLKAGDRLEIVGAERQREHARLDYLNFKPVASR